MKIYKLCTDADSGLVLRTGIKYFRDHFRAKPMAAKWRCPRVEILNKSKRVHDFVSWMLSAPVVSERARVRLEDFVGNRAEFLPLIRVKGTQLSAMNVLNVVDCLDIEKSDILFDPGEAGRILDVRRYAFDFAKVNLDPVVFKVPEDPGQVFVTQSFADVIVASQLSGSLLVNPLANPFSIILSASADVIKPV